MFRSRIARSGPWLLLGIVVGFATPSLAEPLTDRGVAFPAGVQPTVRDWHPVSKALVIGIGRYTHGWDPLPRAAADAYRIGEALVEHGFEVTVLADEAPPTAQAAHFRSLSCRELGEPSDAINARCLVTAIREFMVREGADPTSRLVLWYSGHGATLDGEGFLVGSNAPPQNPSAEFLLRAVQIRELGNLVRLARARHVLTILDSCFAATIFEPRRALRPVVPVREMIASPVRQFITSGGAGETVPDRSVFADEIVAALRGAGAGREADANRDGVLTGSELGLFLSLRVSLRTKGDHTPQYGELLDERYDRGNFVLEVKQPDTSVEVRIPAPIAEPKFDMPLPFRDCAFCPEMIEIPREGCEGPIGSGLAIGVYEVTFAEWDACVSAGGCRSAIDDAGWGRGRRPVMRVTLDDARDFAAWVSKQTGRLYRLPTSAEWQCAARSGSGDSYWFGRRMEPGRAVCRGCDDVSAARTAEVGSLGRRPGPECPGTSGGENCFGLHDTAGNVWEWACGSIDASGRCLDPAIHGGSWSNDAGYARWDSRAIVPPTTRSTGLGFRVARDR